MRKRSLIFGLLAVLAHLHSAPLRAQIVLHDGQFSGASRVYVEIDAPSGSSALGPSLEKIWPEYDPSTAGGSYLFHNSLQSKGSDSLGALCDSDVTSSFLSAFNPNLWTLNVSLESSLSFSNPSSCHDMGGSTQAARIPFMLLSRAFLQVTGSETLAENFPAFVSGSGVFVEDATSGAIVSQLDPGAKSGSFTYSGSLAPGSYILLIQDAPLADLTTRADRLNESCQIQFQLTMRSLP